MSHDGQAIGLSFVEMMMRLFSMGFQRKLSTHNTSLPMNVHPNEDQYICHKSKKYREQSLLFMDSTQCQSLRCLKIPDPLATGSRASPEKVNSLL
jgi:hypothetical protein